MTLKSKFLAKWLNAVSIAACGAHSAAGAAVAGDQAATATLPPAIARQVMPPVAYRLPGTDRVRVRRDIRYAPGGRPEALMDIYLPETAGRGTPRPAILFIHGSTDIRLRPKDWGFFQSWGRLAAASGMAGVTFTQDLPARGAQIPPGSRSVSAAIAFLKAHSRELGIDAGRLCLAVFSAGGPLIAPYLGGSEPSIRCIAAYYPLLDLRQSRTYFRFESAETLSNSSPIDRLGTAPAPVPLLIARGGKDELPGMRESIDRFSAQAIAANWPLTLLNHPAGPHGFDNQLKDRRTGEIVKATLAFFGEHLQGPAAATSERQDRGSDR